MIVRWVVLGILGFLALRGLIVGELRLGRDHVLRGGPARVVALLLGLTVLAGARSVVWLAAGAALTVVVALVLLARGGRVRRAG